MAQMESVSPVVGALASCLMPRPSLPSVAKSIRRDVKTNLTTPRSWTRSFRCPAWSLSQWTPRIVRIRVDLESARITSGEHCTYGTRHWNSDTSSFGEPQVQRSHKAGSVFGLRNCCVYRASFERDTIARSPGRDCSRRARRSDSVRVDGRVSKWRRWGLHIHGLETLLNDQFGSWDEYLGAIETQDEVRVMGITGYPVTPVQPTASQ